MKPNIGIIFGDETIPSDQEYLEAVVNAGGNPVVLRPKQSQNIPPLDGLLLTGGEDVDPEFYRESKEPFCEEIDRKRDEFEFKLIRKSLADKKPIFAICRGVQTLNVALGGTLYQDLQHQFPSALLRPHQDRNGLSREQKRAFRHPVSVKSGTKLHQILGEHFDSNSRHHQAIKKLAPALELSALSEDGVIEGVEGKGGPWILGVQWHPESVEVIGQFAPLFQTFIEQCQKHD